jgi:hypothetical protein
MTNDEILTGAATPAKPKYDLEERTACFGEAIIAFARKLPANAVTNPIISQIVRSGTSVGANYCEADDAVSRKEFRLNIGRAQICFWPNQSLSCHPHPGPLPLARERENRRPPIGKPAAVLAGRLRKPPRPFHSCSFSLGEKVRMRASLSQNSPFSLPFQVQ